MDSGLDNRMHVWAAPQGVGAARRGKRTGWRLALPASPHSNTEDLGSTNSNLRPGLLGHFEGLVAKMGGYDTSFNST